MKLDKYVRITKIDENTPNPNGVIIDYWVEGILTRDIKVGLPIKAWRMRNSPNPTGKLGLFTTSPIKSIDSNLVKTENSTYRVEEVPIPSELQRTQK